MDQPPQAGQAKQGINQNMLIAIIGAAATILAALIPTLNNFLHPQPTATFTSVPATAALPTDTALPTFTFTPGPAPTETLTPTPVPPTETPTTPVGIYDVYLALDKAGEHPAETFGAQQTVYIFFSLNDPSSQNLVKVAWATVDVKGRFPDSPLGGDESTILTPKHHFEILLTPWPVGTYKVDLYLNGALAATKNFEIK